MASTDTISIEGHAGVLAETHSTQAFLGQAGEDHWPLVEAPAHEEPATERAALVADNTSAGDAPAEVTGRAYALAGASFADGGEGVAAAPADASTASFAAAAAAPPAAAAAAAVPSRTWQPGRLLEQRPGRVDVRNMNLATADNGLTYATFTQQAVVNGRWEIVVAQGNPINTTGPAVWTARVADANFPANVAWNRPEPAPRLAVSPGGNAVVSWARSEPCPGNSIYACGTIYATNFTNASGFSPAPVRAVYTWDRHGGHQLATNDRGDQAILHTIDTNNGTGIAVTLLTGGSKTYRTQQLPGLGTSDFGFKTSDMRLLMDAAGRLAVVAESGAGLVAYHGTVAGGFGSRPTAAVLEAAGGGRSIDLVSAKMGLDGTLAAIWTSSLGATKLPKVAVRDAGAANWQVTDLSRPLGTNGFARSTELSVPDLTASQVVLLSDCKDLVRRGSAGWPSTMRSLPAGCQNGAVDTISAYTRNGGILTVKTTADRGTRQGGVWAAYDRGQDKMIKVFPAAGKEVATDWVLGVPADLMTRSDWWEGWSPRLAVVAGIRGTMLLNKPWATLPSPAVPAGIPAPANNLWALAIR